MIENKDSKLLDIKADLTFEIYVKIVILENCGRLLL